MRNPLPLVVFGVSAICASFPPAAASQQLSPSACGDTTSARIRIDDFRRMFADSSEEAFRSSAPAMQTLEEGDTVEVVSDASVCTALRTAVAAVPRVFAEGETDADYALEFYRFGEYYAVYFGLPVDASGAGTALTGYTRLLIFRRTDFTYVKQSLV